MSLTLDLDALLQKVTDLSATITGIRHSRNYDDWPEAPPGLYNREQALHLTGFPEEEPWVYRRLGIDMNEFEFVIPMYTVVLHPQQVKRNRSWVQPFFDRYPAKFATSIQLDGLIAAGSALYTGGRVVRSIPEAPAFDGYYMLRHQLQIHYKGHVSQEA